MARANKQNEQPVVIKAYKGFNTDLQCTGGDEPFQYEVGKEYTHTGRVEACSSGFHACENPLDVWNYYGPIDARFCEVELSGEISRHAEDSKIASAKIAIKAELSLPQFITNAVSFLMELCKGAKDEKVQAASGDSSKLAASGDSSKLAASGYSSQLAASGDSSIAVAAAPGCTAKAGKNGCIVLTRWVESEKRYRVSVGYVGEGIEADTFYELNDKGDFVKAE